MKRSGRRVVRLNEEERSHVLNYVQKRPAGEITVAEIEKLTVELAKLRSDQVRDPEKVKKILTYYVGQLSAGKKPGGTTSPSPDIFEKFQKELDSIVGRKIRSLRHKCRREDFRGGASEKEIMKLKKENAELKNVLRAMTKLRQDAFDVTKLVSSRGIKKLL